MRRDIPAAVDVGGTGSRAEAAGGGGTEGLTGRPFGQRSLRPLVGVLAAMAMALTGTRISVVALPWFVLVTTGSATQTGLVVFCEMTPYVVVKALTGPLVDRIGPRTVSWAADVASATAAAVVPLLHLLGLLSFPVLLALVAVIGAARGPGDLAKEVMVPEAAERGAVRLERATGVSGVIERLAATAGPAVGGSLVALLGPMAGLSVNAACFALGSVIIGLALPRGMGLAVPPEREPTGAGAAASGAGAGGAPGARGARGACASREVGESSDGPGYWQRFGEGFAFLRREPLLLSLTVMVGITNLLDAAVSMVLIPVWANASGGGPEAIGLLGSAMGAGAVAGSLIATAVAHRLRRRATVLTGFLLCGAPRFLVLGVDLPLGAVIAVFVLSGFGAGFVNPVLAAILFERVPRRLLGRVNALGDALAWSGIPLGALLAGAAVAGAGLTPVLLTGAVAYFLTTNLAGLAHPARVWARQRQRRPRTSAGPPRDNGALSPARSSRA
ncbi:MFS transporter [Streptomyces sp. KLOTTS4A1]|uniref:MFS transporter n=1 Tax=Streptomyces sp. KLOTTS4A1 TaxID=3390996 RepID=UPI0039F4A84E